MRTVRYSGRLGGVWEGGSQGGVQGWMCPGCVCVCVRGECCLGVRGSMGRVHPSPLWTKFLTDACENITFPQLLLRTVIK